MSVSSIESLKIKAKLLQKAKRKSNPDFALKDAYAIIAKTAGYPNWKKMKDDYEMSDILNPPHWSALWKIWFGNKSEALDCLKNTTGYLVPYHHQFFVCDADYIRSLGLSEDDPDLQRVGRDWSSPRDQVAWISLLGKIMRSHKAVKP